MTVVMPTDITYGKVVGRFLMAMGDGPDTGRTPDPVAPVTLQVAITSKAVIVKSTTPPVSILPQRIVCTIDSNGDMLDPQGAIGVWLLTGVYTVSYVSSDGIVLAPHDVEVLASHTDATPLHLTTAQPAAPNPLTASQYAQLASRVDAWVPTSAPGDIPNGRYMVVPVTSGAYTAEVAYDSTTYEVTATAPIEITLEDGQAGWVTAVVTRSAGVSVNGVLVPLDAAGEGISVWHRAFGEWVYRGGGGSDPVVADETAPSAPTTLTVISQTATTATVEFVPGVDADTPVVHQGAVGAGAYAALTTTDAAGGKKRATFTGLTAGSTVTLRVRAKSSHTTPSASVSVSVTLPIPPGWATIATDTLEGADGVLAGRTTTTGGLTWGAGFAWVGGGADSVPVVGGKAAPGAVYNCRSFLPLPNDKRKRVSVDYSMVDPATSEFAEVGLHLGASLTLVADQSSATVTSCRIRNAEMRPGGGNPNIALTGTTTGLPASGRISIEVDGSTIRVAINGTTIATGTSAVDLQTNNNGDFDFGNAGTAGRNCTFDNFQFEVFS